MEYWGGNFISGLLTMAALSVAVPYALPKLGVRPGWRWVPVDFLICFAVLVACQFLVAAIFLSATYGFGRVLAIMQEDASGGLAFLFEMGAETAGLWFPVLLLRLAFNRFFQRG